MVMCSMFGCSNNSKAPSENKICFFGIPKVIENEGEEVFLMSCRRRALWLKRINRKNLQEKDVKNHHKVCSQHFVYGRPAYYRSECNVDWAPNINLGYPSAAQCSMKKCDERDKRQRSRTLHNIENQLNAREPETEPQPEPKPEPEEPRFKHASVQTDLTVDDINCLEKKAMGATFTEDSLRNDDYKVKYYSGLYTFDLAKEVYSIVAEHVQICKRTALTHFQEFFLVLMRLRLALQEEDLAYRFYIDQSTVSRIMDRWLPVMSHVLSNFIIWPDRETLRKTMPECFKEAFGNSVTVIIDCFEVFCERPSSFLPRAQTYSSYKHHNTIKILICITPQGTVNFVSLSWGGRTSDKMITEHCGFLDKLITGDVVLADRGFDISETVGFLHARVLIPAFKGTGRNQLSSDEVEMTREIAHVRIHVERVIGLVRRKYKILASILHHSWLNCAKGESVPRIDHVVRICCALINLCPAIIPMSSMSEDVML